MSWICPNCETGHTDYETTCDVCGYKRRASSKKYIPFGIVVTLLLFSIFIYNNPNSSQTKQQDEYNIATNLPNKKTSIDPINDAKNSNENDSLKKITLNAPIEPINEIKNTRENDSLKEIAFIHQLDTLKSIIKSGNIDKYERQFSLNSQQFINYTDENGATLLHYAAKNASEQMLRRMVNDFPLNIRDNKDKLPEDYAIKKRNKILLYQFRAKDSLIFIAVKKNDFSLANKLFSYGISANIKNPEGIPLIHFAVRNNLKMLTYLCDKGANIGATDENGENVLFVASKNDYLEAAKRFLKLGMSGKQKNKFGITPMNITENKTTKYITDFTYKDEFLGKSIKEKDLKSAAYYLSLGADVNYVNPQNNKAAIHYAIQNNDLKAILFLKNNNADLAQMEGALFVAVRNNNFNLVHELIDYGFSANSINPEGIPLIHFAVKDDLKMLKYLCYKGANIGATDTNRENVLFVAAKKDQLEAAKWLLELGMSGKQKNKFGYTPITVANNKTTKYINDVTYKDDLFVKSIKGKDLKSAAYYLSLGADINYKNPYNGKTAIHYAIENDDIKSILFLKQKEADFSQNSGNRTPLEIALDSKSKNAFSFLVENDLQFVNSILPNGETILHKAVLQTDTFWVKIIIDNGADISALNMNNETALTIAIKHKKTNMLSPTLVASYEIINQQDYDGNYPIHIAAKYADSSLIHHLIQLGADPKQKNRAEEEPIDIAKKEQNVSAINELAEYYFTERIKKKGKQLINSIKKFLD